MAKQNAESEQYANALEISLTPKAPSGLATFPIFKQLSMLPLAIHLNSHYLKLLLDELSTSFLVSKSSLTPYLLLMT